MSKDQNECTYDVCLSCQVEILEAQNAELEEDIEGLIETVDELELKLLARDEQICEIESILDLDDDDECDGDCDSCDKSEEQDEEETKQSFYDNMVNMYYHDDFSLQEMFKRMGKKAVEVEFQKFLMCQDE